MAKPIELSRLLAANLCTDFGTVRQQARELRDAGLMAKEKGGRGAGSMSAHDAAALAVAAVASSQVKGSTDVVRHFAQEVAALAADIERFHGGTEPKPVYEFHRASGGDASHTSRFTGRTVRAIAELLSRGG